VALAFGAEKDRAVLIDLDSSTKINCAGLDQHRQTGDLTANPPLRCN